jgi:hypothetical protein
VEQVRHSRPLLLLADQVSSCLLEFGAGPLDGLAGRLAAEMPRSLPADREDRAPLAGRRAA